MNTIKFFDETLRDGEQQAGLVFDFGAKYEMACRLMAAGIPYIDIMPAVHPVEELLLLACLTEAGSAAITPACMMDERYVHRIVQAGARKVVVFNAVSDRLMLLRDPEIQASVPSDRLAEIVPAPPVLDAVRERMLKRVCRVVAYARQAGLEVIFAAEDASRSDRDFLLECIAVLGSHVSYFLLCDTVGILSPERTRTWVTDLTRAATCTQLGVHFHNDRGLALENTLQAVAAGATMVSGTVLGIGERAGNVALEQVMNGMSRRFGVTVDGIDYDEVARLVEFVRGLGVAPAAPYSPETQRHETGIHVSSLLKDRRSYTTSPDEPIEIWFGKFSGNSNFEYLFEDHLKTPLPHHHYHRMREVVKSLSIKFGRSFSRDEIIDLHARGAI